MLNKTSLNFDFGINVVAYANEGGIVVSVHLTAVWDGRIHNVQ